MVCKSCFSEKETPGFKCCPGIKKGDPGSGVPLVPDGEKECRDESS